MKATRVFQLTALTLVVVSAVQVKDYQQLLALLAFLLLGAEIGLANTKLRVLNGMLILSAMVGMSGALPQAPAADVRSGAEVVGWIVAPGFLYHSPGGGGVGTVD